jgi:hypothetical protein
MYASGEAQHFQPSEVRPAAETRPARRVTDGEARRLPLVVITNIRAEPVSDRD